MRKVPWPPKALARAESRREGEPMLVALRRLSENDRAAHGNYRIKCCDCGLVHLYDVALLNVRGKWWLVNRSYREDAEDGRFILGRPKRRKRKRL